MPPPPGCCFVLDERLTEAQDVIPHVLLPTPRDPFRVGAPLNLNSSGKGQCRLESCSQQLHSHRPTTEHQSRRLRLHRPPLRRVKAQCKHCSCASGLRKSLPVWASGEHSPPPAADPRIPSSCYDILLLACLVVDISRHVHSSQQHHPVLSQRYGTQSHRPTLFSATYFPAVYDDFQ